MLEERQGGHLQVNSEGKEVKSNGLGSYWKGYVMALLLSMTTMIYGMNVARSIIQEKTSRIFEVMLAIAKPSDMLAGKLIGVGAVGLTQIGIWVVAAAVIGATRPPWRSFPARCPSTFPGWRAYSFPSILFSAICSMPPSSRGWRPPARPSRNCRCTRLWPLLPIWLSFSLIVW